MPAEQGRNAARKRELSPFGVESPRRPPLKRRRSCCMQQTAPSTVPARGAVSKRQHSPEGAEVLQPRQVKRRRTCSSHATVLAVSQGQGAASEKQHNSSPGGGGALRLVLEPPSVPVRRRRLPSSMPLQLDEGNHVRGSVNGHECRVRLDTGAQITVVFWSEALRLGLIDGTEPTTTLRVRLWCGPQVLQVVRLSSITIDLGGGVRVVTPATVFPACVEAKYDAQKIILDAHQLRRGGMLQVFGPGGSSLFVRRPRRLCRPSRRRPHNVPPDLLRVRATQTNAGPMTVLLDTGAKGVYVSAARRALLLQGGGSLPLSLEVEAGDGCCLHLFPLKVIPSNDQDFVFGTNVLCKYGAVLDHDRHTLDLRLGAAWRRLSTQARATKP